MWLHIIDTDKFFRGIVEMFEEAVPGQHVFVARVKTRGNVYGEYPTVYDRADFVEVLKSRSDWKGVVMDADAMLRRWRSWKFHWQNEWTLPQKVGRRLRRVVR